MKPKVSWLFYLLTLFSQAVMADTHYVATNGDDSGDCTSEITPCLTLNYGISQMNGGDILEIGDGVYSGDANNLDKNSNIPPGTDEQYTVIKAANVDDKVSHVTITSAFNFAVYSSEAAKEIHHVEFDGLKIQSTNPKNLSGHHLKVFRTGFEGSRSSGGFSTFSLGHNNLSTASNNILLEDIWSYGIGGRYNVMVYNSENVIVRRAFIRHDGGWPCDGSNPESGMVIYNSRNVELQNIVVVDGITNGKELAALIEPVKKCQGFTAYYNVSNSSGVVIHENTRNVGSIALNNNTSNGFAWDDSKGVKNALLENSFVYNSSTNGAGVNINGNNKDVTITNVTIGESGARGIAKYGNGNVAKITNTIVFNSTTEALKNVSGIDSLLCYGNQNSTGCNIKDTDPLASGLVYLPRIETASYLLTAGSGGTTIGARVINKTGVDGTLYGETGFNTEQGALWPWPNEDRIAADMCPVRTSGFCATNITDYVWSALGTATPVDLKPMAIPQSLKIQKKP